MAPAAIEILLCPIQPQGVAAVGQKSVNKEFRSGHPMRSIVRHNSETADLHHSLSGLPGREPSFGERVPGIASTPSEDLHYRGGHTIPNLEFVNLYVGGDDAWTKNDVESIDRSIAAAMSDRNLNNVMM